MPQASPREPLDGVSADTERKRSAEVVRAALAEVVNGHDYAAADGYFTGDFTDHHPNSKGDLTGFTKHLATLTSLFPDLRMEIDHLIAQNDRVMVFGTWTGHQAGTRRPLRFTRADLFQVRDGRIAEHWDVVDYAPLTEFGYEPPSQRQPGTPPDRRASPAEVRNIELVLHVWDKLMVEHRLDIADEHYLQDYIQHNALAAQSGAGLEGMKEFFAGLFAAAPDFSSTITHILAQDDLVAIFADWSGHETTTGMDLDLCTADILRIEDGRIAEHWDVFDYAAVAKFGIAPPAEPA
ncbi:hypothetical protein E1264_18595 [Actinomadura sp. KC216]|uniref:ester cyclase n=1 Tax=Actinomadura sp. KC216 TaxID=2530370 RepID=UPI0010495B82|nr:ester cyclase [Actinomadura sp. KC216]TDB86228.1 hypothetical protein E1264_18595 [Actinomadura sp. KC216]